MTSGVMDVAENVRIVSSGFTWTSAGAWGTFLTLVGFGIRQWLPWKKVKLAADEAFRDDLMAQLTKDRGEHAERVQRLEEKMDQQRAFYEAKLEQQRAEFSAELAKLRHRANNATMCLDAMLMLLKAAPDKVADHIVAVTAMRESQRIAEAAESGQVSAAKLLAITTTT